MLGFLGQSVPGVPFIGNIIKSSTKRTKRKMYHEQIRYSIMSERCKKIAGLLRDNSVISKYNGINYKVSDVLERVLG